jgi:hypothetical protein
MIVSVHCILSYLDERLLLLLLLLHHRSTMSATAAAAALLFERTEYVIGIGFQTV